MIKKLKSSKGESIAEVLIASLVMVLAFVMVANMIAASHKMIRKTDEYMADYYNVRNQYEDGTASGSAGQIGISYTGDITMASQKINVTLTEEKVTANGKTYDYISFERVK